MRSLPICRPQDEEYESPPRARREVTEEEFVQHVFLDSTVPGSATLRGDQQVIKVASQALDHLKAAQNYTLYAFVKGDVQIAHYRLHHQYYETSYGNLLKVLPSTRAQCEFVIGEMVARYPRRQELITAVITRVHQLQFVFDVEALCQAYTKRGWRDLSAFARPFFGSAEVEALLEKYQTLPEKPSYTMRMIVREIIKTCTVQSTGTTISTWVMQAFRHNYFSLGIDRQEERALACLSDAQVEELLLFALQENNALLMTMVLPRLHLDQVERIQNWMEEDWERPEIMVLALAHRLHTLGKKKEACQLVDSPKYLKSHLSVLPKEMPQWLTQKQCGYLLSCFFQTRSDIVALGHRCAVLAKYLADPEWDEVFTWLSTVEIRHEQFGHLVFRSLIPCLRTVDEINRLFARLKILRFDHSSIYLQLQEKAWELGDTSLARKITDFAQRLPDFQQT